MPPSERELRIARNEARLRDINDRLEAGLRTVAEPDEAVPFVCECGFATCEETIELGFEAYEAVRSHTRHFFVLDGHQIPDVEDVVERHRGYLVVEKPFAVS